MGTIRRLSDIQLGSIGTTKILSITTAQTIYTINSGNRAFEISNLGSYTLYYGAVGGVTAGSASFISASGQKMWDTVVDNFTMGLKINTAGITNLVVIDEYAGN